jgi:hypothetical protein
MDAPQGLTCRHCGHDAFDFEDLAEGTRLICTDCGTVAEDVDLVAGGPPETGGRGGGVYVAADDDGTRAGVLCGRIALLLLSGGFPSHKLADFSSKCSLLLNSALLSCM